MLVPAVHQAISARTPAQAENKSALHSSRGNAGPLSTKVASSAHDANASMIHRIDYCASSAADQPRHWWSGLSRSCHGGDRYVTAPAHARLIPKRILHARFTFAEKVKRPPEAASGPAVDPLPAVAALPPPSYPGSSNTSDDGSTASLAAAPSSKTSKKKPGIGDDEGKLGSGIRRLRESERILRESNAKLQVCGSRPGEVARFCAPRVGVPA